MHKLFLMLIGIFLLSCSSDRLFEDYHALEDNVWHEDSIQRFELEVEDTSSFYQINFHLRHTADYDYRNLFVFVDVLFPDKRGLRDTMNIMLADPSGRWYGDGVGALKSVVVPFRSGLKFPLQGKYIFEFNHGMRETELKSIQDIGLEIVRLSKE